MEMFYSIVIYALTFILSTFFIWLSEKKKRLHKFFVFVAIVIPSVTAAFRESGVDFWTYKDIYYHIHNGGKGYTEWGWNLLNKISPTYQALLFLAAFIFLLTIYIAITKFKCENKEIAWFSILIIPYTAFFNGMRQMLAVSFVFLAIACIFRKKHLSGIILVLLGAGFHKTAYFAIIILWLYYLLIRKKKKVGFIITIISLAALVMAPLAIALVGRLGIFSKYFVNDTPNVSFGFLLYLLPPLFFYYRKRSVFDDKMLNRCVAIYLLSIPFQVLGFRITYADRFMWFSQIFIAVIVSGVVSGYNKVKPRNNIKLIYYGWFAFYHLVVNIILNGNAIYPYRIF